MLLFTLRLKGAFVRALELRAAGMVALLFAACGGGSGGDTGKSVDGSIESASDACSSLSCLATVGSLVASCAASGSCVAQVQWTDAGTTMLVSECHANAVKTLRTGTQPGADGTVPFEMTVTKGGSVCYALSGSVGSASAAMGSFTYRNASGSTILTETIDQSGNATVTCPGGTPTLIDAACDSPVSGLTGLAPGMDGTCTQGTCSF
jgi:hypothetical protein